MNRWDADLDDEGLRVFNGIVNGLAIVAVFWMLVILGIIGAMIL